MHSIYYAYQAGVLLTSSLIDDGAISYFFRIEDLDLHNLAVKKASSLLLMPLDYFLQITCKYIHVVLLLHLKTKGSLFIINITSWLSTRVVIT
jgi:hypothetical protein